MSGVEPPTTERKRRLSITKLQRETAAGAELIALCQTVTEDGSLADEEVEALRQWLSDHKGTDLPAHAFLLQTVETIIADGRVTTEERQELYRTIETILPADIREFVRDKRLAQEKSAKEEARLRREAAKEAQREARARNRPVESWDFMVAGARYEGRPEVISNYAEPGDSIFLVRDRANRFSRHAVEVRLANGMQIGFVPEEDAGDIAPLLDTGHRHTAFLKKILTGGRSPIPVVVASLYSPEADIPGLVSEQNVPAKVVSPAARLGCVVVLTFFGALLAAGLWAHVASR